MKIKIIKNCPSWLLCSVMVLLLASCTVTNNQAKPAPLASQPLPEEREGRGLAMSVIEGLSMNDYKLFTKNFTDDLKSRFTLKDFNTSVPTFNERYGSFISMEYLGTLKISGMDVMLWKAKFSKDKNDALVRLIIGKIDGSFKVFGWSIE